MSARRLSVGFLFVLCLLASFATAASTTVVISQVYGGGGNSRATLKNDFIELHNVSASTVSLAGWSVQYAAKTGSSWQKTTLSGSIAAGAYYLVQEAKGNGGTVDLPTPDATGTIAMSATEGKVALVSETNSLTGTCPKDGAIVDFVGFGGTANCFEGTGPTGTLSNETAAIRNGADTDNNAADFVVAAPNPRNSGGLHITAAANPPAVGAGESATLSATVSGAVGTVTVSVDLTAFGLSATQALADTGANVFTYVLTPPPDIPAGSYTLNFTATDALARTLIATTTLTIIPPPIAIHTIQGGGDASPFAGQIVSTTGVVTAVKTSGGLFIQTPDIDADSDPMTSEGIFVFTGSSVASVSAGDLVFVAGKITEYIPSGDPNSPPSTEINLPLRLNVMTSGNPLPAAANITSSTLSPSGPIDQLEPFEGMRVHFDSLTTTAPTDGSVNEKNATATSDGIFYAVITGTPRPFREPGIEAPDPIPTIPCCIPRFDSNPERLRVDSDALVGTTALDVTSDQLLTDVTGVLDFGARTYTLLPEQTLVPASAAKVARPVSVSTPDEFTVGSFNLQHFDDTLAAFATRLTKASLAIRNVMQMPDILGVEEVETIATLRTLAEKVNGDAVAAGQPDPGYTAYLEEGNDQGGIDVGFLVKASRVTVVSVLQVGKDTPFVEPDGTVRLLNDRPPLVLHATVHSETRGDYPVTVIVNHLRSLIGIDDPGDGPRVRSKRRAQAEFLANLIASLGGERVISVGDYNAFGFNDGYVDSIGTIKGTPADPDHVLLASPDLLDPDLINLADTLPAAERYSYVFDGNAQSLDHILVTPNLDGRLEYARNNGDFPETYHYDASRPERTSDHDMAVGFFTVPVLDSLRSLVDELTTLRGTTHVKLEQEKLDDAIKHLVDAADAQLWLDPMHPAGPAVFTETKNTAIDLVFLLRKSGGTLPAVQLQAALNRLVENSRALALTAIGDADARGGADPNAIDFARAEVAKGNEDITSQQYESGIEHYRNAWSKAAGA